MQPKKWIPTIIFVLILLSIWAFRGVHRPGDQEHPLPAYVVFQDRIASTALDYCYQYNPDWRCTGVTLCAWPNDTATVVLYANYTINCTGLTCRPVNGTYYKAVINTTDWEVIGFEPAGEGIFQEVVSECERVWNATEG